MTLATVCRYLHEHGDCAFVNPAHTAKGPLTCDDGCGALGTPLRAVLS
jgi:hypothetical protein